MRRANGTAFAEALGGLAVQLGKAQIEPADRRVGDEALDEIGRRLILRTGHPVLRTEQHRHRGGVEIVGEGPVGAQRLLQVVQREAGIGGEEGAGGVDGFQHHLRAAAAAHAEAQDAQQVGHVGRIAACDLDDLPVAGQLVQFARLRKVAVHQLQVLGRFQGLVAVRRLVAVGHHVARQGGKDLVRPASGEMAAMRANERSGPGMGAVGQFSAGAGAAVKPLPGAAR